MGSGPSTSLRHVDTRREGIRARCPRACDIRSDGVVYSVSGVVVVFTVIQEDRLWNDLIAAGVRAWPHLELEYLPCQKMPQLGTTVRAQGIRTLEVLWNFVETVHVLHLLLSENVSEDAFPLIGASPVPAWGSGNAPSPGYPCLRRLGCHDAVAYDSLP